MTPPNLTAVPPTVHRRRTPPMPSTAHRDQADRIRGLLAANEPVTVSLVGRGRGWFVTAVTEGGFEVWRDGTSLTVAWVDVPLGAV